MKESSRFSMGRCQVKISMSNSDLPPVKKYSYQPARAVAAVAHAIDNLESETENYKKFQVGLGAGGDVIRADDELVPGAYKIAKDCAKHAGLHELTPPDLIARANALEARKEIFSTRVDEVLAEDVDPAFRP